MSDCSKTRERIIVQQLDWWHNILSKKKIILICDTALGRRLCPYWRGLCEIMNSLNTRFVMRPENMLKEEDTLNHQGTGSYVQGHNHDKTKPDTVLSDFYHRRTLVATVDRWRRTVNSRTHVDRRRRTMFCHFPWTHGCHKRLFVSR